MSDTETYWANWDFSPDEGEFNWWIDGGDVIYPDPDYTSTSCRVDWTTGGQGTVWYSYSTWDNWWEENFPVYVSSPIPLPDAPVINTPTNITATSFTANWNSVTSATSYQLEVSTDPASWGTLVYHQYSTVATSDNVTSLSGGTTYYYRVRAVNETGVSGWTMEGVLTLPATPVVYEASNITASSFTASWISVTGAENYLVDVWTETASVHTNLPVSGTSVNITGLSAGTTFYYRVRARNTTGASGYSVTKEVLTLPAAPINVYANNVTTSSFTANWGSVTSAASYRLDVSAYSTFSSFMPGYDNLTANTTSQSVTGLSPGTTYHYRVRAVNASGVSANAGNEVLTIPDVPTVYNASNITASSFTANWSSQTGAEDYLVDVWTGTTSVHSNLSVSAPTLAVTGLLAGTVYYYRVRARMALPDIPIQKKYSRCPTRRLAFLEIM